MKTKTTVADADMSKAGRALERAAARARQLAEQTGTPLYIFKDGQVVNLNRQSVGCYVLREGQSGIDPCPAPTPARRREKAEG